VKATLTSKGQITIPLPIRSKLHLKAGNTLDFDESAPSLKASKTISAEAWNAFGHEAVDPWEGLDIVEVMEDLGGPVGLHSSPN